MTNRYRPASVVTEPRIVVCGCCFQPRLAIVRSCPTCSLLRRKYPR
ncbi:hypothetical protein H6F67_25340 [Microcoleus sp. FACHB-1515]|nr:hypothetical protein [Microcoleus sp. FACHB-1515]MBD2093174.1 hypothetical protein [Microcoleus sp. FACHB-1515]